MDEFVLLWFKDAPATFGTTHPDELPMADQRVRELFVPYFSWIRKQQRQADKIGTPAADLEVRLKVTPFLIDAGFTHPDYVEKVVGEFMAGDLAEAEERGLEDLAERIRAKMEELLRLIESSGDEHA